MAPRALLIDTDGAADDVVALMMAARAPDVRLVAVTVVAGTVGVEVAARNVRACLALAGCNAPVVAGAAASLERGHRDGQGYHGVDGISGLSGVGSAGEPRSGHRFALPELPAPVAEADDAAQTIAHLMATEHDLVIVTLGPLTNLARALRVAPQAHRHAVARCVVMGGAPDGDGNMTPFAEYNFWADPEAADEVMASGLPIELVGWKLSRGAAQLTAQEASRLATSDSALARFAVAANQAARDATRAESGEDKVPLPDAVAMAIALDPAVATHWSEHLVRVEESDEAKSGATILTPVTLHHSAMLSAPPPSAVPVRVCETIDDSRWKTILFNALGLR